MSENEKKPAANRFRGAWDTFRLRRDQARTPAQTDRYGDLHLTAEEIARIRAEAEAEPYVSPGLKTAAAWSWRSIVVLVGIGVALWLLSQVSDVLLPALIALLLAALLAPLTGWLARRGAPQALAAAASFVGFIVVVVGLLILVGQQIYSGMPELVSQVITGFSAISAWLANNPFGIDSSTVSAYIDEMITTATSWLQTNSSQLLGGAWRATSSVGSFLTGAVLCLFTTFFFLYDGKKIFKWMINLLPIPAQRTAEGAALRGWRTLVQYVRSQILVAGIDAIGIGIGAAILGVPLVVPLTVLVFLSSFIPVVGAIASGVIAVLVALVSNGFASAIIMLIIVIAVQQIESQVLQPFIMGKAVSVHPLAVVLGVAAGAFLFGIVGALFAVPLIAVLNTVVGHIVRSNGPRPGFDPDDPETAANEAEASESPSESADPQADDSPEVPAPGAGGMDGTGEVRVEKDSRRG
ncbi:putative PurR-regulated permease PerM [Brevibacterium sanguinis]|uniref:PurR-regulated permease PerM n=2 Tax=Brevibacterium TaxID=1696 RepID=A0ABX9GVF4_9MICO|nr:MULTISPECIES: AI-2E family transporter [Brevibacterium]RBP66169.1 putative PurR-regulated permease PerM [Brevibacterium sanguinis]RBP72820.1 putative PurR-regulated permease PerM [Brevibacterium celere]